MNLWWFYSCCCCVSASSRPSVVLLCCWCCCCRPADLLFYAYFVLRLFVVLVSLHSGVFVCSDVFLWTGGEVLRFRPAGGAGAWPPYAGRSATYHGFRLGVGHHDPQPTQGQCQTQLSSYVAYQHCFCFPSLCGAEPVAGSL